MGNLERKLPVYLPLNTGWIKTYKMKVFLSKVKKQMRLKHQKGEKNKGSK